MSQLRLQVYREGNAAVPRTNSKVVLEPALYDDIREVRCTMHAYLSIRNLRNPNSVHMYTRWRARWCRDTWS